MSGSILTNRNGHKRWLDTLFARSCALATWACVLILVLLIGSILYWGFHWLDWQFLTSFPSRFPEKAGVRSALMGSVWLIVVTALLTVPVGVASAIYLEEYASRTWWQRVIQTNIANLAGVPSIVYGILGLGLFVRILALGRSVIAGALTLSLVVLPIVILAAQEALRAVPPSSRHASYALGATRWQTVFRTVLPAALPGIMTGVILALARAMGEAAPLVTIGALTYVAFDPASLTDMFTALPIQVFDWSSRPQHEFQNLAAAGILVLLALLLCLNVVAVVIRHRSTKGLDRWQS